MANGDVCAFPWCRKVKHLLYHLVSCEKDTDGNQCTICCPKKELSPNLTALMGLNTHRRNRFKERVKAVLAKRQQMAKAAAAAAVASATKAKMANPVGRAVQHSKIPVHRTTAFPAVPKHRTHGPPGAIATVPVPTIQPTHHANAIRATTVAPRHQQVHYQKATPNPASAAVAASTSSAAPTQPAAPVTANTTVPLQPLASPELSASASLSAFPSALSVSALPTLEEAALEIGDISLSTSDLMGPTAAEQNHAHATHNHTPTTIVVKSETTTATSNAAS